LGESIDKYIDIWALFSWDAASGRRKRRKKKATSMFLRSFEKRKKKSQINL
jgi:hypothetical protein